MTGVEVAHMPNPRKEVTKNDLHVRNDLLPDLGLEPITLEQGLLAEVSDVAKSYADRADLSKIPSTSTWTEEQEPGVPVGRIL